MDITNILKDKIMIAVEKFENQIYTLLHMVIKNMKILKKDYVKKQQILMNLHQ